MRKLAQLNTSFVDGVLWRRLREDGPDCLVLPAWVLRLHRQLGTTAARTLVALWCWLGWADSCEATPRELAALSGASVDTVRRGLAKLEQDGWLSPRGSAGRKIWHATPRLLELKFPRLRGEAHPAAPAPGPTEVWVPRGVLAKPADLTARQWWVLLGLYAFWQRHAWCDPSQRQLADLLGVGVSAVRAALAELVALGYVASRQRYNRSNCYTKTARLRQLEAGLVPTPAAPAPERDRDELAQLGEQLIEQYFGSGRPRP